MKYPWIFKFINKPSGSLGLLLANYWAASRIFVSRQEREERKATHHSPLTLSPLTTNHYQGVNVKSYIYRLLMARYFGVWGTNFYIIFRQFP